MYKNYILLIIFFNLSKFSLFSQSQNYDSLKFIPYDSLQLTLSDSLDLTLPLPSEIVYGEKCGLGGEDPLYRNELEQLVLSKNKNRLKEWLWSDVYEIKMYAVEGILRLQNKGIYFNDIINGKIDLLEENETYVYSCSACSYYTAKVSDLVRSLKVSYAKENKSKDLKKDSILRKSKEGISYNQAKEAAKLKRISLYTHGLSKEQRAYQFTEMLLNKIIPYWYGTKWSFEGHSSIPKKGEIACGYFISTTLKDVGFNLNRYKLAQQSPINVAKSLALYGKPIVIEDTNTTKCIEKLQQLTHNGLYFIGFDAFHVAYLLKRNGELYLIHSNYTASPAAVMIESIEHSNVFASCDKFYLVAISENWLLQEKWLLNEKLEVISN